MPTTKEFLQKHNIVHTIHEHKAVFTCEEAEQHTGHIPGLDCKNLFLRNKNKTAFLLVTVPASKRVNLKQLSKEIGYPKLSFGSPELLMEKLGLTPGSVSPFGLLNDPNAEVLFYIDKDVYDAPIIGIHPNRNTATVELPQASLHKFLELMPHKIHVIDVPEQ